MKRLTWLELSALGVLAILAISLGANHGPVVGLLSLATVPLTARTFIADRQVDDAIGLIESLKAGRWL